MNNQWQIFTEQPNFWGELCQTQNSLFHSAAWQNVLSTAFKATPLFLYDQSTKGAAMVTVFRAGPFRVGYIGFPAGQMLSGNLTTELAQSLPKADWPWRVDLLRLNASQLATPPLSLSASYEATWETVVPLAEWSWEGLAGRVRRDVRKAQKSGVQIEEAGVDTAVFMSKLYQQTVQRHGGTVRYTPDYFQQLVALGQTHPYLRAWVATMSTSESPHQPIAFLVAVREGTTVFYLHGGLDRTYRKFQPSDLLLYTALDWAKNDGATLFNMMSSPLDQPSLVRYKEKWGGTTGELRTYDWPLRSLTPWLFHTAVRGYNLLSRGLTRHN